MTPSEFLAAIVQRTGAERVVISMFDDLPSGVVEVAALRGETWGVCRVDNSDWNDTNTLLSEVVAHFQRTFDGAHK